MSKLNLGCGRILRPKSEGWINLDYKQLKGVDILYDVEKLPLPFKEGEFEEILCQDILEHINYPLVLGELHKVLKKGGILKIRVPHFSSRNNFIDPTHKKMFSVRTFDFFVKGAGLDRDYYFDFCFDMIEHKTISFKKGIFFYNYPIQFFVNLHPKLQDLYEATFLCRMFPAESIIIYLIK